MKRVCAVILNYMEYELTISLVRQLRGIGYQEDIIVVDNASANESYEKISEGTKKSGVILIKNSDNGGYAKGNNIGIKRAKKLGYPAALIMNNDIEIQDVDAIYSMYRLMKERHDVGCVSPRILSPSGVQSNQKIDRPNVMDYSFGIFRYEREQTKKTNSYDKDFEIYRPQGSCMMVDTKIAAEAGYLDENTFLYFEEDIFAERLREIGRRCMCCSGAQVIHHHSKTTDTVFSKGRKVKIYIRSGNYYLKNYRKWNIISRIAALTVKGLSFYK